MTKKFLIIIFIIIVLALVYLFFRGCGCGRLSITKACFENNCFEVEVAENLGERSKGLMFRENLAEDKGMLFIFEKEEKHSFWMKNTLLPLDIIWINSEKEVIFISKDTQPCKETSCPKIEPDFAAKYVLEIKGGLTEKTGLKVGDKIDFEAK